LTPASTILVVKVWRMIIYEEFRVIAIPDNSTDRAVKRALMLRLPETVQEDENPYSRQSPPHI
jgi:hypothetical protein